MKIKIEQNSITLEAETSHERDAVVKLLKHQSVTVRSGDPWGPRESYSAELILPDPSKW